MGREEKAGRGALMSGCTSVPSLPTMAAAPARIGSCNINGYKALRDRVFRCRWPVICLSLCQGNPRERP